LAESDQGALDACGWPCAAPRVANPTVFYVSGEQDFLLGQFCDSRNIQSLYLGYVV
jgi:hypothetical protein